MTFLRKKPLMIIVLIFSFLSVGIAQALQRDFASFNQSEVVTAFSLLGEVYERIKKDYVEEISNEKLVYASIRGMLNALDMHSAFYDPKEYEKMRIGIKSEFGGLGVQVTMDSSGLIKVISPYDNSPAFKAGIETGDYIHAIDGEAVFGMNINDAVDRLRGDPGTKVHLTILREGLEEPIEVDITREIISVKTTRSELFDGIGYIRTAHFTEKTVDSVKAEYQQLKKKSKNGLTGIVLDMRNNPGGLLEQAVALSDAFLEGGIIVSTKGRASESDVTYRAHPGDITDGLPIVVLINAGSASAPEIVAGALQDHKRAIILGQRSYGKGSVQTVFPLGNNKVAMKLTTALYYTPSGRSIQAEGIKPDIVVQPARIEYLNAGKKVMSEASLPKYLGKDGKLNDKSPTKAKKVGRKLEIKAEETPLYDRDFQLARALDLLKGMSIIKEVSIASSEVMLEGITE